VPQNGEAMIAQADGAPVRLERPTVTWTDSDETLISQPFTLTIAPVTAPPTSPTIDTQISVTGADTVTAKLTPASTSDLLVALVAADGPTSPAQTTTVTGSGLTWTLVRRTNTQHGTAEVWTARAPAGHGQITVKSNLKRAGSFQQQLTVFAFASAGGIGAVGGGNAMSGAPTATLTTTVAGSWVFGVGNDWDGSILRTPGPGQTIWSQATDLVGDTFWTQGPTGPTPSVGTQVTVNDSAPTVDRWNLSLVEVLPAR